MASPYAEDDELSAFLRGVTSAPRESTPADLVVLFLLGAMTMGFLLVLGRCVLAWIS